MTTEQTDRKLQEHLLLAARVEGDRLMLSDAVINAALDGSRALTEGECAAMRGSPLTLRRFKALAQARRANARLAWEGSRGMLRAAFDGSPLAALTTDDGFWSLHFLEQDGAWHVILALDAAAPFAAQLLREQPLLRVLDGQGAVILQGSLDSDGECETKWRPGAAPGDYFQQTGAAFAVLPVSG
jgi:hypothetical protein